MVDPEGVRLHRDDDEPDERRLRASSGSAPSVGQIFRRARLARGVQLEDVARDTFIRHWQLQAIEDDNFGALASAVHAKGLLRVYARYLELDPEQVVRLLDVDRYWVQPTGVTPATRFERPPSLAIPKAMLLTLVTVLVAGFGYYLARQYAEFVAAAGFPPAIASSVELTPRALPTNVPATPTSQPTPPPSLSPTPNVVAAAPTAVLPTPTNTRVPSPTPRASPTPKPVRIEAVVTGRSWLQVEVDGEVVFSGTLKEGDRRSWTGQREISVWTGNAGGVNIIYNGQELGALGTPGQVKVVQWTAS